MSFQDHPLNQIFDSFNEDDGDPLRLKIGKRLTAALEQIDGGALPGISGVSPRDWFVNLRSETSNPEMPYPRVLRGRSAVGDDLPIDPATREPVLSVDGDGLDDRPIVVIRERPFLDLLESKRAAQEEVEGTEVYELLVQGWPRVDSTVDSPYITDAAYLLFEDIRARLAILQLDEGHPKRVFRIGAQNNTVLRLDISDGTVEADDNEVPGAFLRLAMVVIENLADSTTGG